MPGAYMSAIASADAIPCESIHSSAACMMALPSSATHQGSLAHSRDCGVAAHVGSLEALDRRGHVCHCRGVIAAELARHASSEQRNWRTPMRSLFFDALDTSVPPRRAAVSALFPWSSRLRRALRAQR